MYDIYIPIIMQQLFIKKYVKYVKKQAGTSTSTPVYTHTKKEGKPHNYIVMITHMTTFIFFYKKK